MDDSVVDAGMTVLVDICAPDIIPGSPLSPAVQIITYLKKYSMQAGGDDNAGEGNES